MWNHISLIDEYFPSQPESKSNQLNDEKKCNELEKVNKSKEGY